MRIHYKTLRVIPSKCCVDVEGKFKESAMFQRQGQKSGCVGTPPFQRRYAVCVADFKEEVLATKPQMIGYRV
jgi:hypothetical protein